MAGHYVQNTDDEDLVFLELFVAPEFQDISLNKWLRGLPQQTATAHTNLEREALEGFLLTETRSYVDPTPLFALCTNRPRRDGSGHEWPLLVTAIGMGHRPAIAKLCRRG